MTKLALYLRLAGQNLAKNRQYYFPFFLIGSACTAMCYLMLFLTYNDSVMEMRGAAYVLLMLGLGSVIMAFLSVWIMAYANGFVIRRRNRELALYNILGMQKSNIAAVLGFEMLFLCLACVAAGLALGALFSKLMLLVLLRLMRFEVVMGFSFSIPAAWQTAAAMAVLFFCLYLFDLRQVRRADPINLLHSDRVGEREPKSRWLLALFGLVTLGAGYYIAVTTTDIVMVILLFFVAVALVIVGTHCLFGAGSVVALKALRRNKRFYYQPRHFTAVSGMIYRMNQNARGLANICILVTTVLVSVATTVCLYMGIESTVDTMYPNAIGINAICSDETYRDTDFSQWDARMRQVAADYGVADDEFASFALLVVDTHYADGAFTADVPANQYAADAWNVRIMHAGDYARLTGQTAALQPGQVLANGLPEGVAEFTVGGVAMTAAGECEPFPALNGQMESAHTVCLVVADQDTLADLVKQITPTETGFVPSVRWVVAINPASVTDAEQVDQCATALQNAAEPLPQCMDRITVLTNIGMRQELYNMNGSFVFLGIFLAVMFTMATVLIIYYKQLSEGYEDRSRFVIMQQVGMSAAEVRATIRSQVLMIFFLPLIMAAIHLAAAFPMLFRLISAFGVADQGLFVLCCLVTLGVFALCYVAVYALTAKKYYAIVKM